MNIKYYLFSQSWKLTISPVRLTTPCRLSITNNNFIQKKAKKKKKNIVFRLIG